MSVVDQEEKEALDCVWESVFTDPREKAVLLIASKELCRKVNVAEESEVSRRVEQERGRVREFT